MDLGAEATRETFASGLEMGRDVLVALGFSPEEQATQFMSDVPSNTTRRCWPRQHLIYGDEAALLESAKQARSELEQLFEADVEEQAQAASDETQAK